MENKYADKQIINMNVYKLEKEAKKSIKLMHCGNYFVPLEKTLESPLDGKEIQPVRPTGNQPWIFTGRTDAEAKAPLLWPPDVNSPLTEKTLMLGKIEGKRRNGWQRMRWLDGIIDSMDMSLSNSGRQWRTRKPGVLQSRRSQRIKHNLATEWQQLQTEFRVSMNLTEKKH